MVPRGPGLTTVSLVAAAPTGSLGGLGGRSDRRVRVRRACGASFYYRSAVDSGTPKWLDLQNKGRDGSAWTRACAWTQGRAPHGFTVTDSPGRAARGRCSVTQLNKGDARFTAWGVSCRWTLIVQELPGCRQSPGASARVRGSSAGVGPCPRGCHRAAPAWCSRRRSRVTGPARRGVPRPLHIAGREARGLGRVGEMVTS